MSDPQTPASNQTTATDGPYRHTVDLLKFIGSLRGDPELEGYVDAHEVMRWLAHRINELVGLSWIDVCEAIGRLATERGLTGNPAVGYGGYIRDLNHVARGLREAEKDGLVGQLWREMCQKWPIFGKAHGASLRQGSGTATSKAEKGGNNDEPIKPRSVLLDSTALTTALGLPESKRNRVDVALRTFAGTNKHCRDEVKAPRRREPRVLYRVTAVWPHLLSKLQRWRQSS